VTEDGDMPNRSAHRFLFQHRTDTAPSRTYPVNCLGTTCPARRGDRTLEATDRQARRMQFGRKSEKWERQIGQLEFPRSLRKGKQNRRGGHCLRICHGRRARFCRSRKRARTVVVS
jgi:hypothetical protein